MMTQKRKEYTYFGVLEEYQGLPSDIRFWSVKISDYRKGDYMTSEELLEQTRKRLK